MGIPVPVPSRALSIRSTFTHCVSATRAEPGKGLWIRSGAGGGGRRWEWVRRGCSILAVPKESSLHALDLWLKIKLAPVKIYERSVAEVRGNIWMWLVAQPCPPWDLCLP